MTRKWVLVEPGLDVIKEVTVINTGDVNRGINTEKTREFIKLHKDKVDGVLFKKNPSKELDFIRGIGAQIQSGNITEKDAKEMLVERYSEDVLDHLGRIFCLAKL